MSAAWPQWLEPLSQGVFAVDTGFQRPRFDAAFLLVEQGRAAFIDTGPAPALPRLLGALEALGLARDAVDWVIPTHVHLDHAGGVGQLMQALPRARALVHPRGVRHVVDPSALWQGATEVYGAEEMARSYGALLAVPAERVLATAEAMVVHVGGRPLVFADTPGHARHHHCIWDEASRGWFTGDTFGISYREFDTARGPWIQPVAVPTQFEPDVLQASIRRLLARAPQWMYLTHYGRVGDVPRLGALLLAQLARLVALGRREQHLPAAERHAALRRGQLELFCASLAEHGCALPRERVAELLEIDFELNAQGMAIWLDKAAPPPANEAAGA
ncbi:MAG: MBL fold metallo-hydrolase [Rubrivivax sp.]|nr:MBL fold metallo-hydrolase [Rubrivivax sp.]